MIWRKCKICENSPINVWWWEWLVINLQWFADFQSRLPTWKKLSLLSRHFIYERVFGSLTLLMWVLGTISGSLELKQSSVVAIWELLRTCNNVNELMEASISWRLLALIPGVGTASSLVCGCPRELFSRR